MSKRLTKQEFIQKAQLVHGDFYDYTKVDYVRSSINVCISCPVHGEFYQTPNAHLSGSKCPKCALEQRVDKRRLTFDEFCKRAKKVHKDKYDYSLTSFRSTHDRIKIICPIHGIFEQEVACHLSGQGCPTCRTISKRQLICGVGINDVIGSTYDESYYVWTAIIRRCYSSKCQKKNQSYIGCTVSEEWKTYSIFLKWYSAHWKEGFDIDKDVLYKNNKIYSKETCCMIPHYLNTVLIKGKSRRGKLPIGVHKQRKQNFYTASFSKGTENVFLGTFKDVNSAFLAYKTAKEEYIKEVADKYKDQLEPKVYKALYNYKVDIND